ncbi:MAG TPA: DUF5522 domain-containing protein [Saprospiraceae bacterium]|nr:DUF5522 domain-containing protein [Saprospiraceae bacterium]HNM24640.1 DUF5522 domain-containing protein [Saprospiraceae bacterium]
MSKTDSSGPPVLPLIEGRDYYLERGYLVFTEAYLLRRGRCCGSGCRHCPYRKKKEEKKTDKGS